MNAAAFSDAEEVFGDHRLHAALQQKIATLNAAQKQAVQATDGPLLILAGAGTGKTTVLTAKMAYLLAHNKCTISQMLAVTFTNKAASEMKKRLGGLLNQEGLSPPWVGTFHHIGLKILRRHHEAAGLPPRFLILDTDDQLRLLKQTMKAENLDDKAYPPRLFLWAIGRLKDRALLPHQISEAEVKRLLTDSARAEALPKVYQSYQDALHTMGAVDFGDLILLCLHLLRTQPPLLAYYQKIFRYMLVDEYQDINVAQYMWLRLLAQKETPPFENNTTHPCTPFLPNICCVGDDDQSIYGWRGAEVDHILRFEQDFPGTKVIKLEDNYRSTPPILAAASTLIACNQGRLGKTLKPAMGNGGGLGGSEDVVVRGVSDEKAEARLIAHEIGKAMVSGTLPENIAILVRAAFQTREIEEALMSQGIPYRLVGATRFYERQEIKDAVAYLRVLVQPGDNLAIERILGAPKRGLGAATLQKLHHHARAHNLSLWRAMEQAVQSTHPPATDDLFSSAEGAAAAVDLGKAARTKLQTFVADVQKWRQDCAHKPPADVLQYILDAAGYSAMWKEQKTEDARGRLENLRELARVCEEFGSLDDFLEHTSLVTDKNEGALHACSVMTLHTAKGLEFDVVFLAGWEEGLFPHAKALEEGGHKGLEEERRLAYVGLTRAKKRALITYASSRRLYGSWQPTFPSRFLSDMRGKQWIDPRAQRNDGIQKQPSWQQSAWRQSSQQQSQSTASRLSSAVSAAQSPASPFKQGAKVSHRLFGNGIIEDITGPVATVRFNGEQRKILTRFLASGI